MPTRSLTIAGTSQRLDARPDRIDLRDREYQPKLVNLPPQYPDPKAIDRYLPSYADLVLNQGNEGACTGFGLAAVINYLLFKMDIDRGGTGDEAIRVSPAMMYTLARRYDEWEGEDYDGSSCRGAMKGWHKHGVCLEKLWPYKANKFVQPDPDWQSDAAMRPLGAYYRVDKRSLSDMQSAIYETGAVYVSATVHAGWNVPSSTSKLPDIDFRKSGKETGGHAFAIVGYDEKGFIIQNSWGADWGYLGFARLLYQDWVKNGYDAWVAVIGVPMRSGKSARVYRFSDANHAAPALMTSSMLHVENVPSSHPGKWDDAKAYEHSIVLGNNGRPINRMIDRADGAAAVIEVAYQRPLAELSGKQSPKLVVYAHGGLNNEESSITRIGVLAPYFAMNGIYPVFVTWKTGVWESIYGMLEDAFTRDVVPPSMGIKKYWDAWIDKAKEAKDRSLEQAARYVGVKALWSEMKENAAGGAAPEGGLSLLAKALVKLDHDVPGLKIHLVGHSAGSILHGHLLQVMGKQSLEVESCHLYAAACTVRFANRFYAAAIKKKTIAKANLINYVLSDLRELGDTVGPYGKSLLYLVSRALEADHKTPLLGMEAAWDLKLAQRLDVWNRDHLAELKAWSDVMANGPVLQILQTEQVKICEKPREYIKTTHGSFDNDLAVISKTIEAIRGSKPIVPVTCLKDF